MSSKMHIHPRPGNHGEPVVIKAPSTPSSLDEWLRADQVACVIPDGPLPAGLSGLTFQSWRDPPTTDPEWEKLAEKALIDEPPFNPPQDLQPAAGAVVLEPDGRLWLVRPTNGFGGYAITFPKGRLDGKTLQACALAEVFEETGLQVRLVRHLVDVARTQTYTRFYLAERIGGSPADMGWETQCVVLAPLARLGELGLMATDLVVVNALGL